MKDKAEVTARNFMMAIVLFWLACAIACVFFFFGCIERYAEFDLDYGALKYEKLTFINYREIKMGKNGRGYEIYFEGYETPFLVNNITSKKVDKTALASLSKNAIVDVYFWESSNGKYAYDLCEMRCQNNIPLSLDNYIDVNQNNQIIGMIICPIMAVSALFMVWFFVRAWLPIKTNNGLGKLRIEYEINGNVIRIYHSIHVCSLVINDKIFDQHHGVFATHFCLKGMAKSDGKVVRIVAKMGAFHMCLYCNDKLVAKKFMAFG